MDAGRSFTRLREPPVVRALAADHRRLQRGDHVRVVHVVLAAVHVLEQAALLDRLARVPGARGERLGVGLEVGEVRALHAALGAGEAQRHHLLGESDDLEQLRAAVAGDGGDAHLRHDLEQSLAQAGAVAAPELQARREVELDAPLAHHLEQHLVGHVGIHGGGAVADEAGEMMRLARGAGLDEQIALAAQPGLHQVLVHRAGGEQRVRRNAPLDQVAVREQQHQLALAHRALRLCAQPQDRSPQALGGVVLQVEELVRDLLDGEDLAQLALRQDRRAEHHLARVLGRGLEDVALRPDLRLQRHHDRLAQRIDRRVGDLRELLAEVVVERAHLVREHRHRACRRPSSPPPRSHPAPARG